MSSSEETITTAMIHTNDTNNGFNISVLDIPVVIINALLTTPLHIYVTWLIIMRAGNGVASEFFALNVSICEIVVTLAVPFLILLAPFYAFAWSLLLFFIKVVFTARPLLQSCICVERYFAVLHPLLFLKYRPLRYKLVVSCLTWLVIVSCSLMSVVFHPLELFFNFNLFTSPVMLFCCLAILRALKQPGPGEGRREVERANQAKMKAFKIILATLVSLLINLITGTAQVVIVHSINNDLAIKMTDTITFLIMMLTGLTYPLLYLHTIRKLPCKPAAHTH